MTAAAHAREAAIAQLLVGAAIIGTNGLMVRLAGMPPTAVAFWRMLLAGLMLGALVLARHGWQPLSRRAWWWCAVPAARRARPWNRCCASPPSAARCAWD